PVLEALIQRRFEGLVCILSNPVGDLLHAAHSVYGVSPTQLTSFAPGAERARRLLLHALLVRSHLGNALSERDPGALLDDERVLEAQHELPGFNPRVQIEVVGGHGAEIPLFDRCTVDGSPLATFGRVFSAPAFRRAFTTRLRGTGLRLMQLCEQHRTPYFLSP